MYSQTINFNGLHLTFHPYYYNFEQSAAIYQNLQSISFETSQIYMHGKYIDIPRKQKAFGNDGLSYNFSGVSVLAEPMPMFMMNIRDDMQQYLKSSGIIPDDCEYTLNFVLVNYYQNGKDYIGEHSDDETDLVRINNETIIVSLSFGASRDFIFKHKTDKNLKHSMNLKNGDLIIMRGDTQKYWKHALPKRLRVKENRYNLTFRFVKNHTKSDITFNATGIANVLYGFLNLTYGKNEDKKFNLQLPKNALYGDIPLFELELAIDVTEYSDALEAVNEQKQKYADTWDAAKQKVLYFINMRKYLQNAHLFKLLLGTGSAKLLDSSDLNMGEILMQIRDELF